MATTSSVRLYYLYFLDGETEAQEGEADWWVAQFGGGARTVDTLPRSRCSPLHTAASQRLPAWLCPIRKVLRERGFSVKTVPEELNVSCGNNSQGTRKNTLSIINTRKKQEVWFCYIAAKM